MSTKKLFVSLVVITALTGFATAAKAQDASDRSGGDREDYCDDTRPDGCKKPIDFVGVIKAQCSCKIADGALDTKGLTAQLGTITDGTVATICNSKGSKLTLKLDSFSKPDPSQASIAEFRFAGGSGAYGAPNTPTSFAVTPVTISNLSNGYLMTPSVAKVQAQVKAPAGQNLAAGNYKVSVLATVTP
jgi:hypothetical protein